MLIADKVCGIESGDKLIEKCRNLLKIRKMAKDQKLSKSGNSKGKN